MDYLIQQNNKMATELKNSISQLIKETNDNKKVFLIILINFQ